MATRFPVMREKYLGSIRILDKELSVKYGKDKTIFIEHCNDLFASSVSGDLIASILAHCCGWPKNTYVFQTKNPERYFSWLRDMPENHILGVTIETNRCMANISKAPSPELRVEAMVELPGRKFVTIEPVLDFDVDVLVDWICAIDPEFLNLGADSKDNYLPEPTVEKISQLVQKLKKLGIDLREKHNLQRLKLK